MATEPLVIEVYVQPGESHFITEPTILRTVLGSCVGVVFVSQSHGVAALCHAMLPEVPTKCEDRISVKDGRRYVDFAIREIARELDARGILRRDVLVKLFGGADVLPVSINSRRATVGRLNSETAQRVLREEGFEVSASRLGGTSGIQLRFHTDTGEVLVRLLN